MKKQRIFALFFAILFLVTSSSLAIAFIWANIESKNNAGTTNSATTKVNTPSNKLQGTKLAGYTPVSDVSSLQITDQKVGTGPAVEPGNNVTVDYTGALAATGVIFQSSLDSGQPVPFSLTGVIPGFAQGIPGMKVGGTREILIPANLAYGANAQQGIPANSALVFIVTLHSFKK